MTEEQPVQPGDFARHDEPTGYMKVQIPGLDYSVAYIPWNADFAAFAREMRELRDALDEAFAVAPRDAPTPRQQAEQQDAPQQGQQRAVPAPQGASRPAQRGTGLFCPEHAGTELLLSKDEYQPKDDDGSILRDKFYCPGARNGTARNHNVWRSVAVEAF